MMKRKIYSTPTKLAALILVLCSLAGYVGGLIACTVFALAGWMLLLITAGHRTALLKALYCAVCSVFLLTFRPVYLVLQACSAVYF